VKLTDDNPQSQTKIGVGPTLLKVGLLFSLFAFILLLTYIGSIVPWWLLVILALPIFLASEKFGATIFSDRHGWSTRQVGFSPLRILVGVCFILVVSVSAYFIFR
jgi:hypothetical protein